MRSAHGKMFPLEQRLICNIFKCTLTFKLTPARSKMIRGASNSQGLSNDFIFTGNDQGTKFIAEANVCDPLVIANSCPAKANAAAIVIEPVTVPACEGSVVGDVNHAQWSLLDATDPMKGVSITYTNGDACQSAATSPPKTVTYSISCDNNGQSSLNNVVADSSGCNYEFVFSSPSACPSIPSPQSLGTGGVVFVLILVAIFLYIAIGIGWKKRVKGTSGMESIPHIDFWRALGARCGICSNRQMKTGHERLMSYDDDEDVSL